MARRKIIQYAIHEGDGSIWSRVGSYVAFPVLQYDRIGNGGDFTAPLEYEIEKERLPLGEEYRMLRWTRKVPVAAKNAHRAFWGMKPLKAANL